MIASESDQAEAAGSTRILARFERVQQIAVMIYHCGDVVIHAR
jgi:hypothetical protein